MEHHRMVCERHGCPEYGIIKVVLNDPDGSMEWWACKRHAIEFEAWATAQVMENPDGVMNVTFEHLPGVVLKDLM